MNKLQATLNDAYEAMEGSEPAQRYSERHGIESAMVLTVTDDETASLIAGFLADRIEGKTVVEIGGGLGLLAFHMAQYAKRVYVIEASPVWTSVYVQLLHFDKPKNVTFIFGAAEEMAGVLRGDVALFCTHSAAGQLADVAGLFAPEVIDVYGEVLKDSDHPLAQYRTLRRGEIPEYRP